MSNKEKFKKALQLMEVEVFSYCNRKCFFCPNSFIDRRSVNHLMDKETWKGIVRDLREIDYTGEFSFSRYNEPLSQRAIILEKISYLRKEVPGCTIRINTNGDYLNKEYIEELKEAGLDELWVQCYLGNNEKYKHEKMRVKIQTMLLRYEKYGVVITDKPGKRLEVDVGIDGMTMHIRARNFEFDGSSRGGALDLAGDYTREKRCIQPSNKMYIDYNGKIMVCCALRSDVKGHESGVMGEVNGRLWDLYYDDRYKPWRDHHKEDGKKSGLCKNCKIDIA